MTNQLEIFGQLREKLGEMARVGAQVNDLAMTLRTTQKRGVWGEQMLEALLESLLPKHHGPHCFSDGSRVEQAILIPGGKVVPIDSKFTLDAHLRLQNAGSDSERRKAEGELSRALRDRIDETAKYIRPADGTLDFALMFLPAESVYYELACNDGLCVQEAGTKARKSLWNYGLDKHVIPVSPSTMYAYLAVILYGFRGLEIEQKAKQMLDYLLQLQIEFEGLQTTSRTLGGHLANARSKYEELDRTMAKFAEGLSFDAIPLHENEP